LLFSGIGASDLTASDLETIRNITAVAMSISSKTLEVIGVTEIESSALLMQMDLESITLKIFFRALLNLDDYPTFTAENLFDSIIQQLNATMSTGEFLAQLKEVQPLIAGVTYTAQMTLVTSQPSLAPSASAPDNNKVLSAEALAGVVSGSLLAVCLIALFLWRVYGGRRLKRVVVLNEHNQLERNVAFDQIT
jgi:hypothetical protein